MKINDRQIQQVNSRINALITAGSFYGKKLAEAGVGEIKTAEDFEKLPFSEKNDLRDAYPLGLYDGSRGRDRKDPFFFRNYGPSRHNPVYC